MIKSFQCQLLRFKKTTFLLGRYKQQALLFSIFMICAVMLTAQNFTVTSNGDTHAVTPTSSALDASSQITLRSAMEASTQIAGTHIITIPGSITTINLTLGSMTVGNASVGNNITVNGPGKNVLTINQTTAARIFSTGINAVTFSLNDLKLNYSGPAGTVSGGGGAIVAGWTGAVTTLTNVAITNFNIQTGNGGALACTSPSTANSLTVTNCDFSNNTCGAGGGAIYFTTTSSGTITGCTFTGNKTATIGAGTGASGGAIATSGVGTNGTFTITKCTFINNQTTNSSAGIGGGAISNAFGISTISYCRFIGNTAAAANNGNTLFQSGGGTVNFENIIADNNWWGVNSAPVSNADYAVASGGAITLTKSLQLKLSGLSGTSCSGTGSTITASFLTNSASEAISAANLSALTGLSVSFSAVLGTISGAQTTIQAAGTATATYTAGATPGAGSANAVVDNVPGGDATAQTLATIGVAPSISGGPSASTSCAGLSVTFSATVSNQTGITWQESANAGFSSPTTLSNTGIYSGATGSALTISDNTTVNGKYYRLLATNGSGCGSATSAGVLLTATTPTLSANNTVTQNVGVGNNIYYAASCAALCKVVPSGAGPQVTGSVTSQLWVEVAVPTVLGRPFVQRHYQVNPVTNPTTATGTVTLYFSQTEFDNFNAHINSILNLPTGPGDAAGIANVRVAEYSGTTSGGGLPTSYSGAVTIINPPDANIVWNASFSRWEISVDVTGFGGFFVQTLIFPLPVKLISFGAQYDNNAAKIDWTIAQAEDGISYELQRSSNGSSFTTINTQQGDAIKKQFSYTDASITFGKWYYRLQMADRNGKVTYSDIVFVKAGTDVQEITIYPNPVKAGEDIKLYLQHVAAEKIELSTLAGQQVWQVQQNISGSYRIQLPATIAKGMYMLRIYTGASVETRKVLIE
ncbi:T9SS type A sorting domain-containing protein [Ferruginibacter sp.]